MKIELVEETKYNGQPWYVIQIDGSYFIGTGNQLNAEKMYNEILADPKVVETKINVLKSEEINVSLDK